MYGIFMESLVIFKLYTGLRFLLALTAASWIYLLLAEKDKRVRLLLVYAPVIILILFLFPLSRKFFVAAGLDGETYYRVIWTIPMGVITIYSACKLWDSGRLLELFQSRLGFGRPAQSILRWIGLTVTALLIILCGSLVYKSEYITKAENLYHIPDSVIKICDLITPEDPDSRVNAVMPPELIHFVRQYDAKINMPYGREMLVERWGYYNEVYEVMEKPEIIVVEELLAATRNNYCQYIVLGEGRQTDQDPQKAGLMLLARIDGYRIYEDPVVAQIMEEWRVYYEDEE